MTPALPPGRGLARTHLWDNQWCTLYDSAIATAPLYRYIANWVNATIDYPDGTRWFGQFYRCPEGIKRFDYEDYPTRFLLGHQS